MDRPLVIYHGNCADGFAAAWCFWKLYGDGADYVAGVYQEPPPDVAGRDVYLVDFSYKRDVVEAMLRVANHISLIDHHKTAIDDLRPLMEESVMTGANNLGWYCDVEHSGAMLAWNFINRPALPPRLIQHIEDRDLWRFNIPGTREVQANLFSYPYDFNVWNELMARDPQELIAEGAAIERKHHKDIAELVKVCQREMIIGGYWVPVASLPYTLTSDAGHLMCNPYPSDNLHGVIVKPPFAACYWDTVNGRIFSLRSHDDGADVSEIAKQYGGGGHAHAAGFKVLRDHELAQQ